jgi:hypothetical protein
MTAPIDPEITAGKDVAANAPPPAQAHTLSSLPPRLVGQTSVPDRLRLDHLPLQIAMSIREHQRDEDARILRAEPAIRCVLPVALALARLIAAKDSR